MNTNQTRSRRSFSLLGIGVIRNNRRSAVALAAASLSVLLLAGCGGGGGGSTTGNNNGGTAALRSAAVTAVRGSRGASSHLAGNPLGGLAGGASAQRAGRSATRAFALAKTTRQADEVFFDEENGLWSRLDLSGGDDEIKILFFKDQAATQSAGFVRMAFQGVEGQYPMTVTLNMEITAGNEPGRGTATITMNSETAGAFEGSFQDLQTGENVAYKLNFNENGTSTGDFTVTEDGQQYKFEGVALNEDGSMTGNLQGPGFTGAIALNADESGQLTLNVTTGGQVKALWNAAGGGTITFPNGTTQNIADFDAAH